MVSLRRTWKDRTFVWVLLCIFYGVNNVGQHLFMLGITLIRLLKRRVLKVCFGPHNGKLQHHIEMNNISRLTFDSVSSRWPRCFRNVDTFTVMIFFGKSPELCLCVIGKLHLPSRVCPSRVTCHKSIEETFQSRMNQTGYDSEWKGLAGVREVTIIPPFCRHFLSLQSVLVKEKGHLWHIKGQVDAFVSCIDVSIPSLHPFCSRCYLLLSSLPSVDGGLGHDPPVPASHGQ